MNDSARRGGRTLLQASFVAAVIAALQAFGWIHWTPEQVGAFMLVATPIVSFLQPIAENYLGHDLFIGRKPKEKAKLWDERLMGTSVSFPHLENIAPPSYPNQSATSGASGFGQAGSMTGAPLGGTSRLADRAHPEDSPGVIPPPGER